MDKQTTPPGVRGDNGLADAACALGVEDLVDTEFARSDVRHQIELAGAVIGRAEALAMVLASPIAISDSESDPVGILEDVAFRAVGMRGRDLLTSRMFLSLWTARRFQHQVRRALTETASHHLAAVAALLDSTNALLSAVVHEANADPATAAGCAAQARERIDDAITVLAVGRD